MALNVDFINVGYGDAVLVQEQDASFVALIDCGAPAPEQPGTERIGAVEFLQRQNINRLDVLVLTHLHQDHCGVVAEIAEKFDVRELLTTYLPPERYWGKAVACRQPLTVISQKLVDAMNDYLLALEILRQQGKTIRLICEPGEQAWTERLKVRYFAGETGAQALQQQIWLALLNGEATQQQLLELDRNLNQTSIRLRLEYGNSSLELPGDLSANNYEAQMPGPCTLLKLAHHGHRDAMTESLWQRLMPEGVVVSVALEKGDICPDPQILEMFRSRGSWVRITDEEGRAVRIVVTEQGIFQ